MEGPKPADTCTSPRTATSALFKNLPQLTAGGMFTKQDLQLVSKSQSTLASYQCLRSGLLAMGQILFSIKGAALDLQQCSQKQNSGPIIANLLTTQFCWVGGLDGAKISLDYFSKTSYSPNFI